MAFILRSDSEPNSFIEWHLFIERRSFYDLILKTIQFLNCAYFLNHVCFMNLIQFMNGQWFSDHHLPGASGGLDGWGYPAGGMGNQFQYQLPFMPHNHINNTFLPVATTPYLNSCHTIESPFNTLHTIK